MKKTFHIVNSFVLFVDFAFRFNVKILQLFQTYWVQRNLIGMIDDPV